jgi:hypothetical protein
MLEPEEVSAILRLNELGWGAKRIARELGIRAFRNERQESWFNGLESAFAKFGGVPEEVLLDNARALVVEHDPTTRGVQRQAQGVRQALGLPAACLRTVSRPHQGQDRERRRLCEAECDCWPLLPELGSLRGAS